MASLRTALGDFMDAQRRVLALTGKPALRQLREIRRFRKEATWPLFVKPSWGGEGIRTLRLDGLDRTAGRLILGGSRTMEIEAFLHWCTAPSDRWRYRAEHGLIFQDVLVPDPDMAALFRLRAVPSLRIVSLVGSAGEVVIHRVVAKIPLGDNVIDNFALGRTGNMVVRVNVADGRFGHGLRGILPTGGVEQVIEGAPRPFLGAPVPHWDTALDIVARGATAFPLMRIQHWDIVLTDYGPVALELNDLGGTEILQIHGVGLLTAPLREHVRRYGDPAVRPWVAALRA
ncbi:MAG: sugar-transfer associated ATP-grasp domain-containing protein [Rhodothalassiaceae bacterium]